MSLSSELQSVVDAIAPKSTDSFRGILIRADETRSIRLDGMGVLRLPADPSSEEIGLAKQTASLLKGDPAIAKVLPKLNPITQQDLDFLSSAPSTRRTSYITFRTIRDTPEGFAFA